MNFKNANSTPCFDSIDEIQIWILKELLANGERVSPQGKETLEIFPVSFTLNNPRNRCTTIRARQWSFPLAIGEFAWHVSGSKSVKFLEYYAKNWRNFAEDEIIAGSCYGYRIFNALSEEQSQWEQVFHLLKFDHDSRRAILNFWDYKLDLKSIDIPCVNSIQFLIRDGFLHAFVYMRSNDVIWGLPYDVFLFTMLQELLATRLNLELGTYNHFIASCHLYKRHVSLAEKVITTEHLIPLKMRKMDSYHQLYSFIETEKEIRTGSELSTNVNDFSEYWADMIRVLQWFKEFKTNKSSKPDIRELPYASLLQHYS